MLIYFIEKIMKFLFKKSVNILSLEWFGNKVGSSIFQHERHYFHHNRSHCIPRQTGERRRCLNCLIQTDVYQYRIIIDLHLLQRWKFILYESPIMSINLFNLDRILQDHIGTSFCDKYWFLKRNVEEKSQYF